MTVYFISDLHLSEAQPEITAQFERFMRSKALDAQAVYILGDFFDFWIGDDEDSTLIRQVKQLLRQAADSGVKLYFQHGNRDFMIGKKFARESGMVLLPDYHLIDLYGKKMLLCHGDTLCIDDEGYQKYRKIVHLKWLQKLFLLLPLKKRIELGTNIRMKSKQGKQYKAAEIMDANPKFTAQTVQKYGADILIHGHTHREHIHQENNFTRIVLGDWHGEHYSVLAFDESGYRFIKL